MIMLHTLQCLPLCRVSKSGRCSGEQEGVSILPELLRGSSHVEAGPGTLLGVATVRYATILWGMQSTVGGMCCTQILQMQVLGVHWMFTF